jgi:uncharacterized protein (DUF736 family)
MDKTILASGEHPEHLARYAIDGSAEHIWEAADTTGESYLEIDLEEPTWIQAVGIDEPDRWPRYRQNMRLEVKTSAGWKEIFTQNTVGHGLVRKFEPQMTDKIRLFVEREAGPPGIAEWQVYAPE